MLGSQSHQRGLLETHEPPPAAVPVEPAFPLPRRVLELLLAAVPPLLLLGYMLAVGRERRVALIEDDAYYYLGVARSIAAGEGSTFAGLTSTNGYHPLWLLILVPMAAVVQEAGRLAIAVIVVQGVLWAASVREAFRIGDRTGCWECAAGAVAVYSVLALLTGHLAFNGMESGLVLYLLLVLVRLALEVRDTGGRAGPWGGGRWGAGGDVVLGVFMALVLMARLDALFALLPMGVVLLLWDRPSPVGLIRRIAALAGPPAVVLGAYMAVNARLFDSPLPVSGQAKALGPAPANYDQIVQFLQTGQAVGQWIWFGAVGLVLVALAWLSGSWRATAGLRLLMTLTGALVVGEALLIAYKVAFTTYEFDFIWYHYQLALFAFFSAVVLARWAVGRFGVRARSVCLYVAAAVPVVHGVSVLVEATEEKEWGTFHAADFARDHLPADAVLAMGDRAGYFGYIAERPLLHLEGLVADEAYLDQLERGEALDRMSAEGVDYYVHRGRRGRTVQLNGQTCWRFEEPPYTTGPSYEVTACEGDIVFSEGDPATDLTIWRFRPEIQ